MFFIGAVEKELHVKPLSKQKPDFSNFNTLHISGNEVIVVGKNSVYDQETTIFKEKNNLSFFGEKICSLDFNINFNTIDVYILDSNLGFLVKTHTGDIYLSKSLNCLCYVLWNDLTIPLLKLMSELENPPKLEVFYINNDFNAGDVVLADDLDENNHLSFQLWDKTDITIPYKAVILFDSYQCKDEVYVKVHSGLMPRIGTFKQVVLIGNSGVVPIEYQGSSLFDCIQFTSLLSENPQDYLVPNCMNISEYKSMLYDMKNRGQLHFGYSGLSKQGYTVQATIEIIEEQSTDKDIVAKISKLTLIPLFHTDRNFNPL